MAESSDSVSVDAERIACGGGQEHLINTRYGVVSVSVFGDHDKPALITYPDVALNYVSCFQGLFFSPEAAPLLLHNFCIYHICPPGHEISLTFLFPFVLEMGAVPISSNVPIPSVDDLADQIAAVLDYFGLGSVICLGVLAGAYILTLFSIKYKERVLGLIAVSPLCKAPSWTEWLYDKVLCNFLYFYGMCGLIKYCLLQRYFSKEICGVTTQFPESEIAKACRNLLDQRQSTNVWRYLHSINRRYDITDGLQQLLCRTLVFVGENSPFHCDALHMMSKLDSRFSALVEVQACGSMVTEEQPHAMMIPLEYFFMGYGLYRHNRYADSPRSPLSPCCISPELLSPESLGVKLKPIKTRVSNEV